MALNARLDVGLTREAEGAGMLFQFQHVSKAWTCLVNTAIGLDALRLFLTTYRMCITAFLPHIIFENVGVQDYH